MNTYFIILFLQRTGTKEPHQRGQNSERRERVDDVSIARADRIDDAKELTEAVLYLDDNSGMGGMIHISPINNLLTIDKSFA